MINKIQTKFFSDEELNHLISRLKKSIIKNQHNIRHAASVIGISDMSLYFLMNKKREPRAKTIGKVEAYIKNTLE